MTPQEMGRRGGKATVARHGREHMARIGALGFAALARRLGYAGGARKGAVAFLQRSGRLAPIAVATPEQLRALHARLMADDQADAGELPY
jgi:hypothetical protein